ncbi:Sec-independent protein translocase subunit TatA [Luteimicrobium sp. DT211]|uniref:Sec-independent protein translocase subunit TatA n=1 Tax=Luteimicrobium sp. DT211 TaxID=3393412 RepID=UPI003CF5C516
MKPWHVIVLLVVVLLLFGARRLPDLAKSVGQSMKIFKNEVKDLTEDSAPSQTPAQPAALPPSAQATAQPTAPAQPAQPQPAPAPGLLYEREPHVTPRTDPVASPRDDATPPS